MPEPITADQWEKRIEQEMARPDLTSEDVLNLTIAHRLNGLSDYQFTQALGGSEGKPAMNWWVRR